MYNCICMSNQILGHQQWTLNIEQWTWPEFKEELCIYWSQSFLLLLIPTTRISLFVEGSTVFLLTNFTTLPPASYKPSLPFFTMVIRTKCVSFYNCAESVMCHIYGHSMMNRASDKRKRGNFILTTTWQVNFINQGQVIKEKGEFYINQLVRRRLGH